MDNTKEEIWKDVVGYEGYYQVSNTGMVRSVDRIVDGPRGAKYHRHGDFMNQRIDKGGYCVVHLKKEGKSKQALVHRLVAQAFIPNPDNLSQVNHKDGNKLNNNVENLEWCTAKNNILHAVNTGLLPKETLKENSKHGVEKIAVHVLCEDSGEVFYTESDAGKRLHIKNLCKLVSDTSKITHSGRGFTLKAISDDEYKERKQNQLSEEEYDKIYTPIWKRIGNQGKHMKIYCVEQDKYYDSCVEAGKENNMHFSAISLAIKENRPCKGLTFKYVE